MNLAPQQEQNLWPKIDKKEESVQVTPQVTSYPVHFMAELLFPLSSTL